MSQWWKLPPELGGGIGEEIEREHNWVWLRIPGRPYRIKIAEPELTKSSPPCPPEPDKDMTLVDRDGRAWQRLDAAWKCIDGRMYTWQALWEQKGPISVLGPPTPLVIEETLAEEFLTPGLPGRPIRHTWADITSLFPRTVWIGTTVGGLANVEMSRGYAIGQRSKDKRRVTMKFHAAGEKPAYFSFTTDVARDLAEALMYASGDD